MASTTLDYSFELQSCVRGFHIYQTVWSPRLDEELECLREDGNVMDRCACGVYKSQVLVGHLPRKITHVSSLFLRRGGSVFCRIISERRQRSHDLPQGGLEIPCTVVYCAKTKKEIQKVKKLLNSGKD